MEGVTDVVFRQVVAHAARPDLFFTEFTNVSSFASEEGRANALARLDVADSDHPIIAQIWGKNPDHFAKLAKNLESLGFQGLDLNMGCPDRHVNKAGGGAAMINTPDLAVECINRARENTTLPVSVKTRLGFTYLDEYQTWLPTLLNQHLAALTVHLRTRKEMSKVPAHFELIPKILKLRQEISPETKLIINGDIKDAAEAQKLFDKYPELDGIMIGRGVFENPFCFKKPEAKTAQYQPTREELKALFLYHLSLHDARAEGLRARGQKYPYEPLKHFIKVYVNGFNGSKDLRVRLMACQNTTELRETIKTML